MPQMAKNSGQVLHDGVFITVTWPDDAFESQLQTFDDTIGSTEWWKTTSAEYGIGVAKGGGHVQIKDPAPMAITDDQIQQWLVDRVADKTLPPPTDQTVYILYYPQMTTISASGAGDSCTSFGGYHNFTYVPVDGAQVPASYAVIPRCPGYMNAAPTFDDLTVTVSHELNEAATDPHPAVGTMGYYLADGTPWNLAGGESSDLCEFVSSVTEGMYAVTRTWSNANAKLGQQPCVPVPPDPQNMPFFNAGLVNDWFHPKAGQTVETDVQCYSFGPLPNEMTLTTQAHSKGILTMTLSKPTCKNGDVVKLSIAVGTSAVSGKAYHFTLTATVDKDHSHLWRGQVSVK
jgi:hypothetical protein